jgi:hypothetical protein
MGEEETPNSLKTRIDRTRSTYESKSNPTAIIIGASFVFVVGIVLYAVAFSTPPAPHRRPNRAPAEALKQPANPNYGPASGRPSVPRSDEEQAYEFTEAAKRTARDGKVDQALKDLNASLGKWPKYDAELYCAMAVSVGEQETKLQGAALTQMWAQKVEYYQKALSLIEGGGKFAYHTHEVRLNNLRAALDVSKQKAGM